MAKKAGFKCPECGEKRMVAMSSPCCRVCSLKRIAALEAKAVVTDTTGYTTVRLPATAAQGAGKMAPRGARLRGKVQTVGGASEHTKYDLPVRTVMDYPDVHPLDRPKRAKSSKEATPQ